MSRRSSRRRTHKKNFAAAAAVTAAISGGSAPAPSLETFELLPVLSAPRTRRKPGTERIPKVLENLPDIRSLQDEGYVQRDNIPQSVVPGASALATFLAEPGTTPGLIELDDETQEFLAPSYFDPEEGGINMGWAPASRHHARRVAQHATWRDTVIPSLVPAFLRYCHGQPPPSKPAAGCRCSGRRWREILLADWEGTEPKMFLVCRCAPAALQLVQCGYFPCAPKRPSMAFSLRLLEFISLHSLHVAPNNTAWATTLEAFWARRGFMVEETRSFRKRLGNAVQWYQVLLNRKDAVVRSRLEEVRSALQRKRSREHEADVQRKRYRERDADAHQQRAAKRARWDEESAAADADTAGDTTITAVDSAQGPARMSTTSRDQARATADDEQVDAAASDEAADDEQVDEAANDEAANDEQVDDAANDDAADKEQVDNAANDDAADKKQVDDAANDDAADASAQARSSTRVLRSARLAAQKPGDAPAKQERADEPANEPQPPLDRQHRASHGAGAGAGRKPRESSGLSRPNEYLRARCPLCFGGRRPDLQHTKAHAIVCLDANFAQKRRKSKNNDPVLLFSGGRFVSSEDVDAMEQEVDSKRKRPAKRRTKGTSASLDDTVLDECESSFLAAQEKVTKASKNYYADTGLMALLCRHDRVLFLANMTSPGERQHYALVLLRKLFDGLPDDWNVGALYDIACQLSRSIEKHDLLEHYAHRLVFGVSVFHAYGHQWACQLVFHPRKRDGFGLTDGEGCERFWSSIRHLIACLRVSGFWRRQFVLDRQIEFLDDQNLSKMGRWLSKRWTDAEQRLRSAELQLKLCGVSEDVLRSQWKAQVEAQVARTPRQSKHAGDKQIDKILLDLAHVDDLQQEMVQERARLKAGAHRLAAKDVQDITARLEQAKRDIKATRAKIAMAQSQLGTGAVRKFEELRGDAYIRARVNARALRVSIRMAIQAHKFEREKLERDYRRQVMQNKDHVQTRDLVHTRERNITALVKKYNAQVTHMTVLVRDNMAPRRRMALPRALDAKKLFRLDVDDDIWQEDPGLGPQDEGELPPWQVDEDVRKGIRFMLDVSRCREERERLRVEAQALRTWWLEECRILHALAASIGDDQLLQSEASVRLRRLKYFAQKWTAALANTSIDVAFVLPDFEDVDDASFIQREQMLAPDSPPVPPAGNGSDTLVPSGNDSDTLTDDSGSEGSFYFSGDDITEAGEDEYDAHLLDLATAAVLDGDSEVEHGEQPASRAGTPPPSTLRSAAASVLVSVGTGSGVRVNQPAAAIVEAAIEAPPLLNGAIVISSDDDSEVEPVHPAPRRRGEKGRMCGRYSCSNEDLARMASRTAWLSGAGLAVYAESHLQAAAVRTVGHCPSTLLVDVREYVAGKNAGDEEKMRRNWDYVQSLLKTLPRPSEAEKWLIVAHIERPQHWALVAVCWKEREMRFYDSLAARGDYDVGLKESVLDFLGMCEEFYGTNGDVSGWTWVGEKRPTRQTNWFDCGAFVAADFVSLLTSDQPSSLAQGDMKEWRQTMVAHMRTLPVHGKRARPVPLTAEQLSRAETISD